MKEEFDLLNETIHCCSICNLHVQSRSIPVQTTLSVTLSKQLFLMAMLNDQTGPLTDDFGDDLSKFMLAFLHHLDKTWMENTLTKSTSNVILESMWQYEFYRFAKSSLCISSSVSVEVSRGEVDGMRFDISGRLDFYINTDRQWAIEFLIEGEKEVTNTEPNTDADDGSKRKKRKRNSSSSTVIQTQAEAHVSRLSIGGKYVPIPRKKALVVDFRPKLAEGSYEFQDKDNNNAPRPKGLPNYWVVIYARDFSLLEVIRYNEEGTCLGTKSILLLNSTGILLQPQQLQQTEDVTMEDITMEDNMEEPESNE